MTTFALLHGGQHGGWCWDLLVDELAARGHRAVAPDMPIEDDGAGAREWAQSVSDALGDTDGDVVAVAHSMGGMALPVLAAMRPVRRMVFLGAVVPFPGMSFVEYLGTPEGSRAVTMPMGPDQEPDELGRGACSWATARTYFYPDVPSTSLILTGDAAVSPEWQRTVAEGRLGSDVVELPGSHSPFLTRPAELADALVRIAGQPESSTVTPLSGSTAVHGTDRTAP
jgi:pimeloyl-ACP methyl ester carboxylesterase